MLKLKDIFNIDLNSKGGGKLYKKIMRKYNIPLKDVKEVKQKIVECSSGGDIGAKEYYYKFKDTAIPQMVQLSAAICHITSIIKKYNNKFIENSQSAKIASSIISSTDTLQFIAFKYIDIEVYEINVPIDEPIIDKSGLGNLNERLYNLFIDGETANEDIYNQYKGGFELTFEEITKEEYESMITYKP